jgi:hypothetical protein
MDMKTPRVNAARLGLYLGERVRVVAKVVKVGAFHAFSVQFDTYQTFYDRHRVLNHNRHGIN